MNLHDARSMALVLMAQHGLITKGRTFKFDNAKGRFGQCDHCRKIISLSAPATELTEDFYTIDTIKHEIAHALAGKTAGHGRVWKAMARTVGAIPRAKKPFSTGVPGRWEVYCPKCDETVGYRHRRVKRGTQYRHITCRELVIIRSTEEITGAATVGATGALEGEKKK